MCGITGYISDKNLPQDKMLDLLQHRGPDNQGGFTENKNNKIIFLGHTRLSIIDLSDKGNQPMFNNTKDIVIVFNGEVYNFNELKQKYLAKENFISQTDTEVVLKLYEKTGIDFVNYLNGDFAFSIYDKRINKLYLVRDRIGVKPLYYYKENNTFIFASEIKSILASGINSGLNEDEVLNYFVFKYSPKNSTLFKSIFRMPPGCFIEYDVNTGSSNVKQYWKLEKKSEYVQLNYNDAKDTLYKLIDESTRMRLLADVPVGNFLSGGLDSSIIASFLKNRKDISHYCARKSEADLKKEGTTSDYFYASTLAKEWGLNLYAADIGKDEANIELIKKILFYSDDLIADGSQIPSYLITQTASKTSKVIISGMGADELFLGYAGHLLSALSLNWMDKLPFVSLLYNRAARVNQGKGKFLAYRRYIHKIGKYGNYPNYKYGIFNLVGDFENSCSIYKGDKDGVISMLSSYFPENESIFDSVTRFEFENVLVKNLHYTDRMAMANSVESRVPFLDHRIAELAYSLPLNFKLSRTGKSKRILKDAFKSRLPTYVIKRRKAGFGMPLRSIFSSEEKVNSLLDKAFFANFKNFSLKSIDTIIQNHIKGKEDNSSIIYALISFKEWYKLNFG